MWINNNKFVTKSQQNQHNFASKSFMHGSAAASDIKSNDETHQHSNHYDNTYSSRSSNI